MDAESESGNVEGVSASAAGKEKGKKRGEVHIEFGTSNKKRVTPPNFEFTTGSSYFCFGAQFNLSLPFLASITLTKPFTPLLAIRGTTKEP